MHRRSEFRRIAPAIIVAGVILLAACSGGQKTGTTSGKASGASTTVAGDAAGSTVPRGSDDDSTSTTGDYADEAIDPDIELADDVVVVRRVKGKTVKGLGDDGASVLLDGENPDVKKLEVGSVLVLTGVGAGRVTALDDVQGDVAVSFSSVSLPEVVEDGEFSWDAVAVDFADAHFNTSPEMSEVSGDAVEPVALHLDTAASAGAGDTFTGKAGKYRFTFEWKPGSDGGGNFIVTLVPDTDFNGKVVTDVTLEPITTSGRATVRGGATEFFDLDFANLSGKAKITAEISALKQTAAITSVPFFKLPVSVSVPFPIAGIPFTLTFGATIQLDMSIALAQNSIRGETNVSFGGPARFTYDGSSVTLTEGRTASAPDPLGALTGVASGPAGLNLTMELPKVSFGLKIAQTGAGVFVSNGMVNSLTILPAPVLCHRVQVASVVAGGIDAQFLGGSIEFTRKPFLDQRWTFAVPKNDQRCDGD